MQKNNKKNIDNYILKSKELNSILDNLKLKNPNIQLKKIANGIMCNACQTVTFSFSRSHYSQCDCGLVGIDGGNSSFYRIIGSNYTLLPAFCIANKKERREYKEIQEMTNTLKNIINQLQ